MNEPVKERTTTLTGSLRTSRLRKKFFINKFFSRTSGNYSKKFRRDFRISLTSEYGIIVILLFKELNGEHERDGGCRVSFDAFFVDVCDQVCSRSMFAVRFVSLC